jgi:hypothetical protein
MLLMEKMTKVDEQMDEASFIHGLLEPMLEGWGGTSFIIDKAWLRLMPS